MAKSAPPRRRIKTPGWRFDLSGYFYYSFSSLCTHYIIIHYRWVVKPIPQKCSIIGYLCNLGCLSRTAAKESNHVTISPSPWRGNQRSNLCFTALYCTEVFRDDYRFTPCPFRLEIKPHHVCFFMTLTIRMQFAIFTVIFTEAKKKISSIPFISFWELRPVKTSNY